MKTIYVVTNLDTKHHAGFNHAQDAIAYANDHSHQYDMMFCIAVVDDTYRVTDGQHINTTSLELTAITKFEHLEEAI